MHAILGLNGPYHELAACLVVDGEVACMIEEEASPDRHAKAARIDNAGEWPVAAAERCLRDAGLSWADLDEIACAFLPDERLANVDSDPDPVPGSWGTRDGERRFVDDAGSLERRLREHAGAGARFRFTRLPHHLGHAASAWLPSPFEEAAILVVDGIGEHATTWMGVGCGDRMEALRTLVYPHSLGLLWEAVSDGLGFSPYGATKVMGLAAHGNPATYRALLRELVALDEPGAFRVAGHRLRLRSSGPGWVEREVPEALRSDGAPIAGPQRDLAAALQERTEEALLHLATWLRARTGAANLCLAGGVALNCAANGALARSGLFDSIFAQPAANDAGTALGAALACHHRAHPGARRWRMTDARLGPRPAGVDEAVASAGLPCVRVADPSEEAAERIARGEVVGWFDGRCEAGPRALGARSLLGDPRRAELRDHLNLRVKRREPFRPFGPAVLAEEADAWFEIPNAARPMLPFMLAAVKVRPERRALVPAVVHADGSSRPQLVPDDGSPYRRLIERFYERTGVPMVLDTSLNVREPIVESPGEAVRLCRDESVDALLLGDRLVARADEADLAFAPPAPERFEPATDGVGARLALVFGNEAVDGRCPFHRAGECLHCDIGAGEGRRAVAEEHGRRLAWLARHHRRELPATEHLVLYNGGSLLDAREMSPSALSAIVEWARGLPRLRMLSLDTRECFVRAASLRRLRRLLPETVALRAMIGLESADDEVRLVHLGKRTPRVQLETAFAELAAAGPATGAWLNLVFQPPGRTGERAVEDLVGSVRFGLGLAAQSAIPVDFNVHPFYPSRRSREAWPDHPRADLDLLSRALDAAREAIRAAGARATLFVGRQDEGHDQEPRRRLDERGGSS